MKLLKKSEPAKVEEIKVEEIKVKAQDDASMTLTSEEITQLKEALPKLIALLSGEAEIEIIDEETDEKDEEIEEEADVEELEIDADEEVEATPIEELEETEEVEDEKAEDDVSTENTFNAEDLLKDPAKKAAIEKALGVAQKATDEQPKAKKIFVKKTLAKKAGDSIEEPVVKANAELVATPVVKKIQSEDRAIRKFDFHKTQK